MLIAGNDARSPTHRREIDGLRALAVVPVLAFHARLGFPGGYVGVDVFFVIFGYLISGLILKQGHAFSFADFWERRVRRIAPALMTMVAVTTLGAWWWLLPEDLEAFGRSLAAQAVLLANVSLWREANYFIGGARPLLHTWSLAVEEQFYVLFPFLLVSLRRVSPRLGLGILAALALLSFGASVYGSFHHVSATFYLLPTRAWELLVGALIATYPNLAVRDRRLTEGLSFLGLFAILFATFEYSDATRFPGVAALLPVLGAAAIIVSNHSTLTLVGRLLAIRPLVWIGLISYSLYLWHWPVLTFAEYGATELSPAVRVALLGASVGVAWLSWRFVEQPVRARQVLARRRGLWLTATVATGSLLAVGLLIVKIHGAPSRWQAEALHYAESHHDQGIRFEIQPENVRRREIVNLGSGVDQPIRLLVWGDSQAMSVLRVVDDLCKERQVRCAAVTYPGTPPLLDFPGLGPWSLRERSYEYSRLVLELARQERVDTVLLVANWASYGEYAPDRFAASLHRTVRAFTETARVVILKAVPTPDFDVPTLLAVAAEHHRDMATLGPTLSDRHRRRNRYVDAVFDELENPRLSTIDPLDTFIDARGRLRLARETHALFFDTFHLSSAGSRELRPLFAKLLDDSPRRPQEPPAPPVGVSHVTGLLPKNP